VGGCEDVSLVPKVALGLLSLWESRQYDDMEVMTFSGLLVLSLIILG
jgi:hypothetical protein